MQKIVLSIVASRGRLVQVGLDHPSSRPAA